MRKAWFDGLELWNVIAAIRVLDKDMRFYKIATIVICLSLCANCSPQKKPASEGKAVPSPKINQQSFEGVHRAAKAIDASIGVGINYIKFQELLQSLATEISIARNKVKSPGEKDLLGIYVEVLSMYHDSAVLWSHKIEHSGEVGVEGTGGQQYDYVDEELSPIIAKYKLDDLVIRRYSSGEHHLGKTDIILMDESMKVILHKAHDQLEAANGRLNEK